jgi:hypothetical protein
VGFLAVIMYTMWNMHMHVDVQACRLQPSCQLEHDKPKEWGSMCALFLKWTGRNIMHAACKYVLQKQAWLSDSRVIGVTSFPRMGSV